MKPEDVINYINTFKYYLDEELSFKFIKFNKNTSIIYSFYSITNGGFVFSMEIKENSLGGNNINYYENNLEYILKEHFPSVINKIGIDKFKGKENIICIVKNLIIIIKMNDLNSICGIDAAKKDAKNVSDEIDKLYQINKEKNKKDKIEELEKENIKLKEEIKNIMKTSKEDEKFMDSNQPFSNIKRRLFSFMKMSGKSLK